MALIVPRVQIEKQWFRPCKGTKKAVEYKGDGHTNCNWHTRNAP